MASHCLDIVARLQVSAKVGADDTGIKQLLAVMEALRNPQSGCPWDIEQDFSSVVPYTIEEAYEVADAIDRGEMGELRDELGDLLFQVVFHARMAEEQGAFDFSDVVAAIVEKMVRRHPHVFADEKVAGVDEQTRAWEAIKEKERQVKGLSSSTLDGITRGLPALTRTAKLQRRAAGSGFEWPEDNAMLGSIEEQVRRVQEALAAADPKTVQGEIGELMFACVNLATKVGVDAEQALRSTNTQFVQRFHSLEQILKEQESSMEEASSEVIVRLLDELNMVKGNS